MLSAFGGALAAEGFAPAGVLTPEKIALPDKPTVVGPMPRMGGGLSGFVEIVLNHASITLENPMVRDFSVEIPVTWVGGPRYYIIDMKVYADHATYKDLEAWAGSTWAKSPLLRIPMQQGEWICIYCGSINPMPRAHCSQCGGTRDWTVT